MNEASTWVCLILAQLLVAFATSHWFLYHKVVRNIAPSPGWDPRGGTPLYVRPQRVWFFSRFSHK